MEAIVEAVRDAVPANFTWVVQENLSLAVCGLLVASIVLGSQWRSSPAPKIQVVETPERLENVMLKEPGIRDAKHPTSIICYNPATGEKLGERRALGRAEVLEVVEKARKAQRRFATTSMKQRQQILKSIYDYVSTHVEQICEVACRDSGKTSMLLSK